MHRTHWRHLVLVGVDAAIVAVAVLGSYVLRFDGPVPSAYLRTLPWVCVTAVIVRVSLFAVARLYSRVWAYASLQELLSIVTATTSGSVLFFAANALTRPFFVPRSVIAIELLLSTAAIGAVRMLLRLRWDYRKQRGISQNGTTEKTKRILVVGAGDAGAMAVREIQRSTGWTVVGFIDDDRAKHGQRVYGVPVLGNRTCIKECVNTLRVTEVLVAIPSAPRSVIRETLDQARAAGCTVRTLPALHELMDGKVTVNQIREVRIEDLLRRDSVPSDIKAVRSYLQGRVVLITGAGGSIGSELCRQVARCDPARLVLFGHGENSIFEIQEELQRIHPNLDVASAIADMRDERRVATVLAEHRPAVVFHAAAHKHVPLMEAHPDEAATNNVFGTLNLSLAADRFGAERFVMISTDKAVNPTNCMGASKRLAEMIVQNMNWRSVTRFVAVRFGNVLGSRGSVIPTFKQQIAAGGPITVTHPEMRRYFMTIPEAVQLVLEAGHLAEGGEIYLLEMGQPVKIVDLARDMIRLSGFEPDVEIPVVFTGVRPGEKLFEELRTDAENVEQTSHPDIVRLHGQEVDPVWLEHGLEVLRQQVAEGDTVALRTSLVALGQGRTPEDVATVAEVAAADGRRFTKGSGQALVRQDRTAHDATS